MTYCSCGLVAIDETEHYCRFTGDKNHFSIDKLSKEDFREFLWIDIENRAKKIKNLDTEHLLNIVIYFEEIPEKLRNYFYDILIEEVLIRGLQVKLNQKRIQNRIIFGSFGPVTNTMNHFSDEHIIFVILYIEEIGMEVSKFYYSLAIKEMKERGLDEELALERLLRHN